MSDQTPAPHKIPPNQTPPKAIRPSIVILFCIIIVVSIAMHLILRSDISGAAILYVGIPSMIAVLLLPFTATLSKQEWKSSFARLSMYSLIIMLASSAILFEGFLCVAMFMPIYFGVVFIVFLIKLAYEHNKSKSRLHLHVLPLLLFVAALEGISPELSFNRYNEVSTTKVVNASVAQIKHNLIQPVELNQERHWFLSLFPMPYQMDAKALEEGDVHTIHYRYHRWFVTNTHEGYTKLKVAEVSDRRIRLEVLDDTSYLATYLNALGTEVSLNPIDDDSTEVTLTIKYERLLDPAWYFDPMQRYATALVGEYLIGVMMESH